MCVSRIGKLVRDLIPDKIIAKGGKPSVRVLSERGYLKALSKKLLEEALETSEASSEDDIREELADVLEVAKAIAKARRISWLSVLISRQRKRRERGGFEKRIFLESVEEKPHV